MRFLPAKNFSHVRVRATSTTTIYSDSDTDSDTDYIYHRSIRLHPFASVCMHLHGECMCFYGLHVYASRLKCIDIHLIKSLFKSCHKFCQRCKCLHPDPTAKLISLTIYLPLSIKKWFFFTLVDTQSTYPLDPDASAVSRVQYTALPWNGGAFASPVPTISN